MSESAPMAVLILSRLKIQNANAISSPMTHGFPSMTALLGWMWALERKLEPAGLGMALQSVGVVCHAFEEQATQGGFVKAFRLTRNPVDKDGRTAAIVEEGRIHLEVTLILGVNGNFGGKSNEQLQAIADGVAEIVAGMRIAGGSVMGSGFMGAGMRPSLQLVDQNVDKAAQAFRRFRRRWLPGFALVCRDDLLRQRTEHLQSADSSATALDAWLDLSRFNWKPEVVEEGGDSGAKPKAQWQHDRTEGWIVPIPVGYGALSRHAPGEVANARDPSVPFAFVESLYSIGQWIGPHRLNSWRDLLWYSHTEPESGLYCVRNDYAPAAATVA